MSADISYCVETGHLTRDAEVKTIGESFLITGSIAVNRSVKKDGKWVDEASFFNFEWWLKSQSQINYFQPLLHKGAAVAIDGQFVQKHYTDKDGNAKSNYVLTVNRIIPSQFQKSGNNANNAQENNDTGSVPSFSNDEGFPEDVPF